MSLDALVFGQSSFCQRVKYSRKCQQLWKKRQQAATAASQNVDELVQVFQNLSYKERRSHQRGRCFQ